MSTEITLKAQMRSVTGKKVRRLRQDGWVPGVIYGPNVEAQAIQIPRKTLLEVYREAGTSALIGVLLGRQRKPRPAIIREVQRDPISMEILHVDLALVDMGRPITAHIPIMLKGEAPVVAEGTAVLTHGVEDVEVRCLPSEVPAHIEVDLSTITRMDQVVHAGDLTVSEQVHILSDPETVVVYITPIRRLEEEEEIAVLEEVEEEREEEAEEGEGPAAKEAE